MRVLIVEDSDDKFDLISTELEKSLFEGGVQIDRAPTLASAYKAIYEVRYGLMIVDLLLPARAGEPPEDMTSEVIELVGSSDLNRNSSVIAISGFEETVRDQREAFIQAGIVLVFYDERGHLWKQSFNSALSRVRDDAIFDFIIVCALEKERSAYRKTNAKIGELRNIRGLDCLQIEIGSSRGICLKLPRMGLVEAASISARAIERFRPKLVSMSGICAGFPTEVKLGTLVIADICWEYQSGKWSEEGFKVEHYDVGLETELRTALSQMVERDPKGTVLKAGLIEDSVIFAPIVFGPMVTGSAVIANRQKLSEIIIQHRKVAALDMEMYGLYKAADLSSVSPMFFGAKLVVDVGDENKDDRFHEYGSVVSARFVVDAIRELLAGK